MIEKKYRKWGSMKNAKEIKLQVTDDTLIYLEHRSYVGTRTQVGYGKAVDDLCRDFQALLKEHQQLLHNYKNLLDKYSAACLPEMASAPQGEVNREPLGLSGT